MTRKTEHPLVSFALITYNQETYIRDAVEGAFSQKFGPLEIVISDDCSTDRTFEIIKEMVGSYSGPHRLVTRKNSKNLGLAEHVNEVIRHCSADFIILAAGDDISVPERAELTYKTFLDTDASLVHSDAYFIDRSGNIVDEEPKHLLFETDVSAADACTNMSLYIGATGAIRKSLSEKYGEIIFKQAYEDLVFGFRAALENSAVRIDQKLVKYRVGVGLSSYDTKQSRESWEREYKKLYNVRMDVLRQRLRDTITSSTKGKAAILLRIRAGILFNQLKNMVFLFRNSVAKLLLEAKPRKER